MTSLSFRLLDTHVINGLADDIAIRDAAGTRSYAQLLHESACIAAGLRHMGIEPGTPIVIDLPPGRELVTTVLACARIGAVPASASVFTLAGAPPTLRTPDTEVAWDLLDKAGRTDPAASPVTDPDGYESVLRETFGDLLATLEAGGTVEAF